MEHLKQHRLALMRGLELLNRIENCLEEMEESKQLFNEATSEEEKARFEKAFNWYAGRRLKALAEYNQLSNSLAQIAAQTLSMN